MYCTGQGRGSGWCTRPLYSEKNKESLKRRGGCHVQILVS